MEPRTKLVSRAVALLGLVLLLASGGLGLWLVSDTQPRCLAGLAVTTMVPASFALLLLAGGLSFSLTRRWWTGTLALLVLALPSVLGGLGVVSLLVRHKQALERSAVEERCAPLRAALAAHAGASGGAYPAALSQVASDELIEGCFAGEEPAYQGGEGGYVLRLPASSLDIDGCTLFSGPHGGWSLLDDDRIVELERALSGGTLPDGLGEGAEQRFVELWCSLHPEQAAKLVEASRRSEPADAGLEQGDAAGERVMDRTAAPGAAAPSPAAPGPSPTGGPSVPTARPVEQRPVPAPAPYDQRQRYESVAAVPAEEAADLADLGVPEDQAAVGPDGGLGADAAPHSGDQRPQAAPQRGARPLDELGGRWLGD